ncbi:FAD-binding domain-containing protein [Artomyces pyxidatus]|uniref:FAD-binding domain-containing protein n=1 Tax=Artomyces pyxidatus TaxID=48021 RepID=A0ACB8SXL0_9AGAM|nr:FAD-binding domain-containing protein [Artomyces pyxidatus]
MLGGPSITNLLQLFLSALPFGPTGLPDYSTESSSLSTCKAIADAVSSASQVNYPPSDNFVADISHWAESSSIKSTCSVQPGTPEDVAKILKIVASSRTPFAVKGGGHTTNPGFSSTEGVQIAMSRFNTVTVNAADGTVDVGAGLTWDQVYAALDGTGINVVGGRIPGVGVAGLTLGGGYSWKSNQQGLTIDTVKAYELVLPNGTITTVTEADKDLWFGLKGGFNNFGIVTKFTYKSYPQTGTWGGLLQVSFDYADDFNAAVAKYTAETTDEKAALVVTYEGAGTSLALAAFLFYDAPSPPQGLFDNFLAIPSIASTVKRSTFLEFVMTFAAAAGPSGSRAFYNCAPVFEYTPTFLSAAIKEAQFWAERVSRLDPKATMSFSAEPFISTLLTHGAPSPYPPDRSRALLPTSTYTTWKNASLDQFMHDSIVQFTRNLVAIAVAEGQDVGGAAPYPNYAIYDTSLVRMYGENVPRMAAIKKKYDPDNVMGLAGGFKF